MSAAFRAEDPEFPWGETLGIRTRIVHGYDHVWRVAAEDLEPVPAALERALTEGSR